MLPFSPEADRARITTLNPAGFYIIRATAMPNQPSALKSKRANDLPVANKIEGFNRGAVEPITA
jgi:hypothetical protein